MFYMHNFSMSFLMVLWVGWQSMLVVILSYFFGVCGDTELTKNAPGMRRNFHSFMPDHKKASTRVK